MQWAWIHHGRHCVKGKKVTEGDWSEWLTQPITGSDRSCVVLPLRNAFLVICWWDSEAQRLTIQLLWIFRSFLCCMWHNGRSGCNRKGRVFQWLISTKKLLVSCRFIDWAIFRSVGKFHISPHPWIPMRPHMLHMRSHFMKLGRNLFVSSTYCTHLIIIQASLSFLPACVPSANKPSPASRESRMICRWIALLRRE